MPRRILFVLVTLLLSTLTRPATACQCPPAGCGEPQPPRFAAVSCQVSAESACYEPGQPIRLLVTVSNLRVENPQPPPWNDNTPVLIRAWGSDFTGLPQVDPDEQDEVAARQHLSDAGPANHLVDGVVAADIL